MAKRNEKVVIDDTELKPQVIGHIFEKKSNIGRVLVIFIIFGLVIYFINDISLFINNLLGRSSADTIKEIVQDEKEKRENNDNIEDYYEFNDTLLIKLDNVTLTHFKYENNSLVFDAYNYTENDIDLSSKNYYIETYDNNKVALESKKIEFTNIMKKNKITINIELSNEFKYFQIVNK